MSHRFTPLFELTIARAREFFREPAAIFWVYGFPLIMAISLGIAFRERPRQQLKIDLVGDSAPATRAGQLRQLLNADTRFEVQTPPADGWKKRLRDGKTDLVVVLDESGPGSPADHPWEIWQEPRRSESLLARQAVENLLLKQQGATDV
ncbi:MAG: hypothetical protein EHM42_08120, partial [Planctomycetaceae bacterium]